MEGPINKDDLKNPNNSVGGPWNSVPDYTEQHRAYIKQEFSEPFSEEEVKARFLDPEKLPYSEPDSLDSQFQLYSKKVGPFEYQVIDQRSQTGESKDMFFRLSKDTATEPNSELVYRSLEFPGVGKGFNLIHRVVRTQKEGISGTTFLKKAEEYLAILKKNNLIECNWIAAESTQPNVTEFLLQNGFHFVSDSKQQHEKYLANQEAYEFINLDFIDNPLERDQAPVLKEAFDDPEFMQYVTESNGVKKFTIDFNDRTKFTKYFPHVFLAKDM